MQNYAIIFKYSIKEQPYCIFIERKVKINRDAQMSASLIR